MEIKTKYDVGHTFWSPRCLSKYIEHQFVDSDGNVWTRGENEYVVSAKHKQIVGIEINIDEDNEVSFSYYVKNYNDSREHQYPSTYDEERVTNYTEEEALAVAQQYADRKKDYYG